MANKVIIASDSTSDLSPELIAKYNISILPLGVNFGDEKFTDGVDIDPEYIYKRYQETKELPKTSAANLDEFIEFFKKLTADGSEVVIFTISSEMSSTYNNARLAALEVGNVYVVDSRNLSTGSGLLVLNACELANDGYSAKDIAEKYGLDLLVENVVCNQQDPLTHMIELAQEYPDIHYIFDTKMAAFHSQLDKLYDSEYAWLWKDGHIRHYHVNDYGGGHMDWANLRTLPIGKGHIDFERFFDYIHEIGYDDTFTVEATAFDETGVVDVDMLNDQFGQIRNYLAK